MAPLAAGLAALVLLLLLTRGFAFANVARLAKGMRGTAGIVLALLALTLLLSGRAGLAFLAFGAGWGLMFGGAGPWKRRPSYTQGPNRAPRNSGAMSRAEALKVLGLADGATDDVIRAAHRRLILQNHPDVGGSNYLAAKINEAKDTLLGE